MHEVWSIFSLLYYFDDNSILWQLWDLTAGKLLHDFKCHDGQIQCIDFHPHEFLLATGVIKTCDAVLHCLFSHQGQSGIQNAALLLLSVLY